MPKDIQLKAMNVVHRLIRRASGGHLGWTVLGMQVLELTTTGRSTGRRHSVMLTSPIAADGVLVIVASRGGDDRHPAWYLNLRANPDVEVALKGSGPRRMRARTATPAERKNLWPRVIADHPNYASYQAKTTREIPLVLLEAETDSPPPGPSNPG